MMTEEPSTTLHVTNGDCAAERLEAAGIGGRIVPWRDILHLGPVPKTETLEELAAIRAAFLAPGSGQPVEQIENTLTERDRALLETEGEIVLWFEHDLYDQLQLLQVLSILSRGSRSRHSSCRVELICIGEHAAVPGFRGLGQLSPQQMAQLFPRRQPLTSDDLALGSLLWSAFTAPSPHQLSQLAGESLAPFEFVPQALMRLFEDYPWTGDGLSRTQRTILQQCQRHRGDPQEMFLGAQQREAAPYLGDTGFALEAGYLIEAGAPLLKMKEPSREAASPAREFFDHRWQLTSLGERALLGEDWLRHTRVERWIGGASLLEDRYRYEPRTGRIIDQVADREL